MTTREFWDLQPKKKRWIFVLFTFQHFYMIITPWIIIALLRFHILSNDIWIPWFFILVVIILIRFKLNHLDKNSQNEYE